MGKKGVLGVVCVVLVGVLLWVMNGSDEEGGSAGTSLDTKMPTEGLKALGDEYKELVGYTEDLRLWLKTIDQNVKRYPNDERLSSLYAHGLCEVQEWDKAFIYFEKSITVNAEQPDLLANAGTCARHIKKYEKAELFYKQAIKLRPNRKLFQVLLAKLYVYEGRFSEAALMLNDVIENAGLEVGESGSDKYLHRAYYVKSELHKAQKKYTDAILDILQAVNLTTGIKQIDDHERYKRWQASLYRLDGSALSSLTLLKRLRADTRQSLEVLAEIAESYRMLGQLFEAGEAYAEVLVRYRTDDGKLAEHAADWFLKAGEPALASEYIGQLLKISPDSEAIDPLRKRLHALRANKKTSN